MKVFDINSFLEELDNTKDYNAMSDLSHENISLIFSRQLRGLSLKK